jgi:hypothetical protein
MEIESDIHEQLQTMGTQGVLGRCLRGIPADVWWRIRTLLERASQAERNPIMASNPARNLWVAFVVVHLALSLTLAGSLFVPLPVMALGGLAMMAGLYVQRERPVTGSWIVLVGLIPTLVSITGVLVLISGLWTANLAFTEKTAELRYDAMTFRRANAFEQKWWQWFGVSAAMFAIGIGALFLLGDGEAATGEDDTSLLNSLAWLVWLLSWVGAIVSAALGIVRGIGRHRTRSA